MGTASFNFSATADGYDSTSLVRVDMKGLNYALSKTETLSAANELKHVQLSAIVNGSAVNVIAAPDSAQLLLNVSANGRSSTARLAEYPAAVFLPDFDPGALETLLALAVSRNNRDLWAILPKQTGTAPGSVAPVVLATYADEQGTWMASPSRCIIWWPPLPAPGPTCFRARKTSYCRRSFRRQVLRWSARDSSLRRRSGHPRPPASRSRSADEGSSAGRFNSARCPLLAFPYDFAAFSQVSGRDSDRGICCCLQLVPSADQAPRRMHRNSLGQVAVSPDGTRLAWVESGSAGGEIRVAPIGDLSKGQRIATAETSDQPCREGQMTWSPDSRALAFLAECAAQDDKSSSRTELYLARMDAVGPAHSLVTLKGYVGNPAFSPDGSMIAFLYVEGATRPASALAAIKPFAGVIGEDGVEIQRVARVTIPPNWNGDRNGDSAPAATQAGNPPPDNRPLSSGASDHLQPLFDFITPANLHVYEFDWAPDSKSLAYVAADPPGENNWWVAKLYTQMLGGEPKSDSCSGRGGRGASRAADRRAALVAGRQGDRLHRRADERPGSDGRRRLDRFGIGWAAA